MLGKETVMEKIVDFERFKYGHSKKRKEEYNIYIDKETNEVIFDPYVNTVLTKLDLLYDNYVELAKKSGEIMKKYNIK